MLKPTLLLVRHAPPTSLIFWCALLISFAHDRDRSVILGQVSCHQEHARVDTHESSYFRALISGVPIAAKKTATLWRKLVPCGGSDTTVGWCSRVSDSGLSRSRVVLYRTLETVFLSNNDLHGWTMHRRRRKYNNVEWCINLNLHWNHCIALLRTFFAVNSFSSSLKVRFLP